MLRFCELSLVVFIDQALVEKGCERIVVDMMRKIKAVMRSLDSPFLLKFCCCLSIICKWRVSLARAQPRVAAH